MINRVLILGLIVVVSWGSSPAAAQEKIKVGYWTSGVSVGFGAVLEAGKFLQAQGLDPGFIRFSDVNAPTKALLTQSIDVAFGASVNGAFTLGVQGVPVQIILATQIGEAAFVAREGSPLRSLADLKGKKVGMSPAGSATYSIAAAVLERNYGLKIADFTAVPGNEGVLVQFLQRGDIDAASLRAVTVASVPDLKLQILGKVGDEWKRMTKTNSPPFIGAALMHKEFMRQTPDGARKFVRGMMEAVKFGRSEPAKAAEILRQTSNLDSKDATSYISLWSDIYVASLEPDDIATFKTMAEIFRASGTLDGKVPDTLYASAPYERAKGP